MGCGKRKSVFKHVHNVQIQINLCMCKVSSGPWISIQIAVVSNDSVSGQGRPLSDCANAQADLGLQCLHMPEDTFSPIYLGSHFA